MRIILFLLVILTALWLVGCADSSRDQVQGRQQEVLRSQQADRGFDQVVQSTENKVETESFDDLLHKLQTSDQGMIRGVAARKLGQMKDNRAVDALCQHLLEDPFPFCRAHCARALGAIGDAKALEALRQAAENDEKEGVRKPAREAISLIEGEKPAGSEGA